MPVRIVYHRPQDLVADADEQFRMGGVLARIERDLAPGSEVDLVIEAADGSVSVKATVLQALGAAGIALAFDAAAQPQLDELVARARALGDGDGPAATHSWVDTLDDEKSQRSAEAASPFVRIKTASLQEKIAMAKHGSKGERAAIIRDSNKTLHQYVVRNPHLQIDEVSAMARMTTMSVDVLKHIAEKREWVQRSEIASALARNPRTPVPLAARALRFVSKTELRQIAKGNGVRSAVAAAARKLLLR